jgi:hypothetical protein
MPLAKDDDVIEQLASERADEPLGETVLPWRPRRDPDLLEIHAGETLVEHGAEDSIAITDDALGDVFETAERMGRPYPPLPQGTSGASFVVAEHPASDGRDRP